MSCPKAVIGLPIFNGAEHLAETLESLLGQTYNDLALVLVDDCSRDETPAIVRTYTKIDPRITYYRNDIRLGLVNNWRRVYELARELFPHSTYFAWASDHDIWHPRWLSALINALDSHPEAVLAYPFHVHIREAVYREGQRFVQKELRTKEVDTRHLSSALARLVFACLEMSAGDMVYGLVRISSLERAGVFRPILLPDRLLLAELSLYGAFIVIPEFLWFRRLNKSFGYQRQRASFFPYGAPIYAYLPWLATHAAAILWSLSVRGSGRPLIGRASGPLYAAAYCAATIAVQMRRGLRRSLRHSLTWIRSRLPGRPISVTSR